jgi:hypothetical protein
VASGWKTSKAATRSGIPAKLALYCASDFVKALRCRIVQALNGEASTPYFLAELNEISILEKV